MKNLKIIVFLFLLSNLYGQHEKGFKCRFSHAKNDLQYHNLKGNIKSIKEIVYKAKKLNKATEKYEFVKPEVRDTIEYIKEIFFNNQGKVTSVKTDTKIGGILKTKGFLEERCTYSSNPPYEIKNVAFFTIDSDSVEHWKFKKDKNKKVKYKADWKNGLTDFEKEKEYMYDDSGNIIQEVILSDNVFGGKGKTNYRYNDQGKLTSMTLYNEQGAIKVIWSYSYDDKNNLIESKFFKASNYDKTYNYFSYNAENDLVEEKQSFGTDTFTYTYDDSKNWNVREKEMFNGLIKQKTIREITYYDAKDVSDKSNRFVNYETGKVSFEDLSGKILEVKSPKEILFKEAKTNTIIKLRLAFMDMPNKNSKDYKRTLSFIRKRILDKDVTVQLFNFHPEQKTYPAAFISYYYEKYSKKGDPKKDTIVFIGKITVNEKRHLNFDLIEGGFAKTKKGTRIKLLLDTEQKAKEYGIGIWSKKK